MWRGTTKNFPALGVGRVPPPPFSNLSGATDRFFFRHAGTSATSRTVSSKVEFGPYGANKSDFGETDLRGVGVTSSAVKQSRQRHVIVLGVFLLRLGGFVDGRPCAKRPTVNSGWDRAAFGSDASGPVASNARNGPRCFAARSLRVSPIHHRHKVAINNNTIAVPAFDFYILVSSPLNRYYLNMRSSVVVINNNNNNNNNNNDNNNNKRNRRYLESLGC